MNIMIDKEVDLNTEDLLQTKVYADTLKELIADAPENESLTIGLFGPWGSGKSSIIKTLKKNLVPDLKVDPEAPKNKKWSLKEDVDTSEQIIHKKPANVKFVIYDAWKYANDSFRRTFILTIQQDLGVTPSLNMKNFYSSNSEEKGIRVKFNIPFLIPVAITLGMACYTYYRILSPTEAGKHTFPVLISLLGFFAVVFSKAFFELKDAVQNPILSAPEKFEECFNDLIDSALKGIKKPWYKPNYFYKPNPIDRIVLVIDNIDRCSKETAYELLTNTKNFIDSKLNVVFLIPIDEEALKNHIFRRESNSTEQSEEFLRKYFNVIVRLKNFRNSEIFDFSSAINIRMKMNLQRDTVNIIAKEYARNPRRIIQFYNNLAVELKVMENKHQKTFSRIHEAAICKYLIIREEWPKEYRDICDHPHLHLEWEPKKNAEDEVSPLAPNSYEMFLDSTYVITRYLELKDLQKILMNADNYENISDAVINVLSIGSNKEIKVALEQNNVSQEKILNYLLFQLQNALNNKLYETDVSEIMDQFATLIMAFPRISKSFLNRLEGYTRRDLQYIIPASKSYQRLANFNVLAIKKKSDFLDKAITEYFGGFKLNQDKSYLPADYALYREYIYAGGVTQVKKATSFFANYLKTLDSKSKIDHSISGFKIDLLYDQAILAEFFFDVSQLPWDDPNYQDWLYLLKNFKDPNHLVANLLINTSNALRNELSGQYIKYIESYYELFHAISVVSLNTQNIDQLHKINDHLFIRRNASRPSFMERIKIENRSTTLLYLLECFRLTNGSLSSAGWIKEFLRISQLSDYIERFEIFLMRYNGKFGYDNLKMLIDEAVDIDPSTNILAQCIFYNPLNDGGKLQTSLTALLEKLISGLKENTIYLQFIKDHYRHDISKTIINNILKEFPKEEYKLLPKEIKDMKKKLRV